MNSMQNPVQPVLCPFTFLPSHTAPISRPRVLVLALACAFTPPAVQAQVAVVENVVEVTGTRASADDALNLDAVAASTSRLGLTLRESPASVTVVDRSVIEARGAQDTQEILRAIPGVTAHNGPGSIGVSYRGFGSGSISQLFNGINVQYSIAARPVDSWIYERVEAIGGPSSFLFGSGAVGGTINYITKLAQRREFGEAQIRVGSNRLKEASFGLNRRVAGAADGRSAHHLRIDLNHRDAGSWVDGTEIRSTQLAASLLSDLAPGWTHTLAYEFQDEDVTRPYWGTPLRNPVAGTARIDEATRFKNYNSVDGVYAQKVHWLRSITEWQAGTRVRLTNTLYAYDALRDYRNVESYRFNPANTGVIRSGILLQRHDHRLAGNRLDGNYQGNLTGRKSNWAFGIDASVGKQTRFPNSLAATVGTVNPYQFVTERFFDLPGMAPGFRPDRDNRVRTLAAYLENRTALSDSVHLVSAVRKERIELELTNRRDITATNPASFRRRYYPATGRLGLTWDIVPGTTAYVQYATAADPPSGVLSTASFADVRNNSELTTGRQAEIGAKLDFWQGKGSATLAVYDITRKNIATQDPLNSSLTVLVGAQSSRGVELALGLQPARAWRVDGNVTLADAQYDNFRQNGVSLAGKTPTNTPRTVANLWVTHKIGRGLNASAGVRRVGSVYADAANTIAWPSYTLLDLGLNWQIDKQLTLTARVRNAGNRVHAVNLSSTMAYLGAPRTADLAMRYTF